MGNNNHTQQNSLNVKRQMLNSSLREKKKILDEAFMELMHARKFKGNYEEELQRFEAILATHINASAPRIKYEAGKELWNDLKKINVVYQEGNMKKQENREVTTAMGEPNKEETIVKPKIISFEEAKHLYNKFLDALYEMGATRGKEISFQQGDMKTIEGIGVNTTEDMENIGKNREENKNETEKKPENENENEKNKTTNVAQEIGKPPHSIGGDPTKEDKK